MHVVDQRLIFLHFGQWVHSPADDMAHIGRPTGYRGIQPAEYDLVVFFGADNGAMRGVWVVAARDTLVGGAARNGVDDIHETLLALRDIVSACRDLYCIQNGARKALQHADG